MITFCPKAYQYLKDRNLVFADELEKTAWELLNDTHLWELVTKSINDRLIKGMESLPGVDRGGRRTKIKRVIDARGLRKYVVLGEDGKWVEPEEKVWVWAMVELERRRRKERGRKE